MRPAARAAAVTLIWLPAGLAGTPALAQDVTNYTAAREASREALQMLDTAGLDAAEAYLIGALAWCPAPPIGTDCRRPLLYTLGYAYQTRAGERPGARDSLLARAFEQFRVLYEENPDFEPAQQGLALVARQAPHEWYEPTLRTLAEREPGSEYALILGDYYRNVGWPRAALDAFRRAMERAPADERPFRRIIDLFFATAETELASAELVAMLTDDLTLRFPLTVADGHLVFMHRVYPRDPAAAAGALPDWLRANGAGGAISPELAREMPAEWTAAEPFGTLRAFLEVPTRAVSFDWWLGTEDRRDALARAALALGHWTLAREGPAAAEQVWRTGLAIAPRLEGAWLRIAAELAALYDGAPDLDPEGAKLRTLEDVLFAGKGPAILSLDYDAMLRFHGTLGRIYAQRGDWGPPDYPRSAIFQLEHALDAAAQRTVDEPVPELRRWLAVAYEATEAAPASRMYTGAAADYLDMDDLEAAGALLDRARELGRTRADRTAADGVAGWLEARRVALTGDCGASTVPRLDALSTDAVSPGFVTRQRFKTLADCSGRVATGGPELAAEALAEALRGEATLVGLGDLVRLEDARRRVYGSFGQVPGAVAARETPGSQEGAQVVRLPAEGRTLYLPMGPDILVAADLVRELRPSEQAGTLLLRVQDGVVTLIDPGLRDRAEVQATIDTIGRRQ